MSEVFGVDVSHYQGRINWQQVAASGIKFVVMKCQYEAQSHRKDECFEYNYEEAGKYGIARGVYIYIARASMADPVGDAKSLLAHLNGRKLEYGIWLDLEDKTVDVKGKAYIKSLAQKYAEIFHAAGYYVGIYCNRDWYVRLIHEDLKQQFDFWIARYPRNDNGIYNATSSLKPSANIAVAWQYSSKGHVAGIPTKVDLDVDYDGIVSLIANTPVFRKSVDEIAQEVIDNKWGTKDTKPSRKELLTMAGYDYEIIRKKVNELLSRGQ